MGSVYFLNAGAVSVPSLWKAGSVLVSAHCSQPAPRLPRPNPSFISRWPGGQGQPAILPLPNLSVLAVGQAGRCSTVSKNNQSLLKHAVKAERTHLTKNSGDLEGVGWRHRNRCRRAHTLPALESSAWVNLLLAELAVERCSCVAEPGQHKPLRTNAGKPFLLPWPFRKQEQFYGTSALLWHAVFGGARDYRAWNVCGCYRVPKDVIFPRSGLTHFFYVHFWRLLSATKTTWQPSQIKFLKCLSLCMAQNPQSVSRAPLWKHFKGDFQMQKEKECLDKEKKSNCTVAARM